MEKTPQEYELFVSKLVKELTKEDLIQPINIYNRKKYTGKSGEIYEIDLSYTFKIGGFTYLTLVECKYWKNSVGRDILNNFKSIIEDIGAHKGFVATTSGFQSGAIGIAAKNGIGLIKISNDGKTEHVSHFDGGLSETESYLTRISENFKVSGEFKRVEGLTTWAHHIVDYVADKYGKHLAAFLENEEIISIDQIGNKEVKDMIIAQIKSINIYDWLTDYHSIECCGMPVKLEPSMYIRLINLKLYQAMLDLGINKQEDEPNKQTQ